MEWGYLHTIHILLLFILSGPRAKSSLEYIRCTWKRCLIKNNDNTHFLIALHFNAVGESKAHFLYIPWLTAIMQLEPHTEDCCCRLHLKKWLVFFWLPTERASHLHSTLRRRPGISTEKGPHLHNNAFHFIKRHSTVHSSVQQKNWRSNLLLIPSHAKD